MPSIYWMATWLYTSDILIDSHEHYQKMSLRNRCQIATPHGILKLSVPLRHGRNQRKKIEDVELYNQENWQSLHYKSLATVYRKSPFFELLEEELIHFFERKYSTLLDVNNASVKLLQTWLGDNKKIEYTQEYIAQKINFSAVERYSISQGLAPIHFKEYQQVFSDRQPFYPNLSTLDIIFCLGPQEARVYLKELYKQIQTQIPYS